MKYVIHIAFWWIFILGESILYFTSNYGQLESFIEMTTYVTLITLPRILVAYFIVYWFIPFVFKSKNKWLTGFVLGLLLAFLSLLLYRLVINYIAWPLVIKHNPKFSPFDLTLSSYSFFRLITPIALLYMVESIMSHYKNQRRLETLEKANLQTELQLLKSQINPHFLFNTLNNIYVLSNKKSPNTSAAIAKLSRLLRFMLYESKHNEVPLKNELEIICAYLELEQLRYSKRLRLNFQQDINDFQRTIAPLLILPLIENAFKHGASESTEEIDIQIVLKEKQGKFYFSCKNSIESKSGPKEHQGMGLQNVKRRLQLLYPERHQLKIEKQTDFFFVALNIDLNEQTINDYH